MKHKPILIFAILLALLTAWLIWDNARIVTTRYTVESDALPEEFEGFVIVQVSDLHNRRFGAENARLLEAIRAASPDILVITGDLIDSRRTNVDAAVEFLTRAVEIAPVYYSTGNHEGRIPEEYRQLENEMLRLGVTPLHSEAAELRRGDAFIRIVGMDDPSFRPTSIWHTLQALDALTDDNTFDLVLSHRPDLFEGYVETASDLVLCGHAHGGQVRIPGLGGVLVPNQGFFPPYSEGLHAENGATMVISRGLGNSVIPVRVFNPSELVVITLE